MKASKWGRLTLSDSCQQFRAQWEFFGSALIFLTLCLTGCAEAAPSTLDPKGPAAAEIANLWWIVFGLGTAVFVLVIGLILWALFHPRPHEKTNQIEFRPFKRDKILIIGGGITTVVILVIVYFLTLNTLSALAYDTTSAGYTIRVIGHQFWWEIHYPDQEVITANEIHIPAGQPVKLEVTTADVIHSFWIPELQGKIDMIPGQINSIWVEADEAGVFYGECAEFCGIQHAKMAFIVVAQPEAEFLSWLNQQQAPAAEVTDPVLVEGQQIFLGSSCVYCHTIRGTNATGILGPDLTHLASRRTLGAASVENNRGNLGGWISDPHSIKPGNKMPPTNLSGPELQALLTYLESLQ